MAVIQISQIQVRRGMLEELGQLGSGEFGWALDKLRLFIGNGTISEGAPYEGNTEILTANSDLLSLLDVYTYKGELGGYIVQTGEDIINKVVRTFQQKVDDFVNVKDFGAKGNGFDDDTIALQRAIFEIYARQALFAPVITRRTINFHPGLYLISSPLLLPPYTTLRNSGKDSVIIRGVGIAANCVIMTTDGAGFSPSTTGNALNPVSKLGPVEATGITFETQRADTPIAVIDSSKGVYFHKCRFVGGDLGPTNTSTGKGVEVSSSISSTDSVHLVECDFFQVGTAVSAHNKTGITDIVIDKCSFTKVNRGLFADSETPSTIGIRVTNSLFNSVGNEGIKTTANVNGVISAHNVYNNVGNDYSLQAGPVTHVLDFGGEYSYSIGDVITRTPEHDAIVESVKQYGTVVVSTHAGTNFKFGKTYQTIGRSVIFNDSTNNLIPLSDRYRSGIVTYSVERNSTHRSGSIKFSFNTLSQKFEFHDSYVETDHTGVDISVEYVTEQNLTTKPYIVCIVDNLGFPAVVTYDIKSLYQ